MKHKLTTILFAVLLFSSISYSQWTYVGAWPDTNYKNGTHGIVVDPDGKIWTASYYQDNWITPTDTIKTCPIFVFNPDGSLLDVLYTVTGAGNTDTLKGRTRGMRADEDGNILYTQSGPSKMIKINYQTRERMGSKLIPETGSSPTAPGVDDNGTIYVGPVVGNGASTAFIATWSSDLTYLGTVIQGPAAIARTMTISGDGLTLYWTVFTGSQGIKIYTRPSELDAFQLTDSAFTNGTNGMSIETVDWDPSTGHLWVSNDARGNDAYGDLTWYAVDVTNMSIVDSFTLPDPRPGITDPDKVPRGLAFSPDGSEVYVGLFGTAYDRLYKFERPVSVEQEGQIVVDGYKLSQNYPNPFNPTTKINFELSAAGFTTLKIYDMLGKEVATLVQNELNSGSHSVNFDASSLASGTYMYQLNVNGTRITNKMILLK
ncbi:MAG: T9SS type A sorting domain-containing protein [Ignavibacteriaceae bacterium]